MSRDFTYSDYRKVKILADIYNISEDKMRSIIETYFALSLYNMLLYKKDNSIFGEMQLNKNFELEVVKQSPEFDNIAKGKLSPEDLLRYISNGTKII